jgi:acetyl-CoA carboxylase biotin carboxyl carrier protein
VPIDFNQLREFIEAIAKTDISELVIKEGDFELTLQKNHPEIANATYSIAPATPVAQVPLEQPKSVEQSQEQVSSPVEETPISKKADNLLEITSPMVGTFYRAPAPGESPFVEVGDKISQGQVVCIIEAMKLMNEIEAEVSGKVVEIAVENGEPVEYGQTLLWILPN